MKKTRGVISLLAVALAGCANLDPYSQPVRVDAGPQPTTAQVEPLIHERFKGALKDPDSVKQFEVINIMKTRWFLGAPISNPGAAEGWIACFQYNAKNSYGGYVGVKTYGLVFRIEGGQPRFIMTQDGAIMAPRCS